MTLLFVANDTILLYDADGDKSLQKGRKEHCADLGSLESSLVVGYLSLN